MAKDKSIDNEIIDNLLKDYKKPEDLIGEIRCARVVDVFHTELATAGRYRTFLQFKRDGVVHTARFTLEVGR